MSADATVPTAPALPLDDQQPDDEKTLVEILSSNAQVSLNTPDADAYLARLTTLPLEDLLAEPAVLQTQSHHLTSSLTTLTHASYPAFLSLYEATTSLSSSLSSFSTSLDSLLQNSLPKLDESVAGWKDNTEAVLQERKKARVVLEQHDKIRDILDIPILIDTCVRNGYFSEALSLASHTSTLAVSLSSSSPSPTPAIIHSIRAEVHHSISQMLVTLLSTLREPNRKLPALWKAVNFLRKMDVFDDEEQIAVAFLGGREECLKASLEGCGRDVQALILSAGAEGGMLLGEREREDVARYLRKYIDLWREGVFDIVTQFTTIFLERSPSSDQPKASSPPTVIHTLISTYGLYALTTHLLPPLKALLPLVPSTHSSLLTQLTYCASAFSRVGMDFRCLLDGLFCEAVGKGVGRELRDAGAHWVARVQAAAKNPGKTGPLLPSRWLVTPNLVSSPPTAVSPTSPLPVPAHIPPPILASYPPLAEFTNKLLGTLNGLRLLAPIGVRDELLNVLDTVLRDGLVALLEYAKEVGENRMKERVNVAGDGEGTLSDGEERVIRATGEVYVKVFVPFMRRALVEGVYGVEMSTETAGVDSAGESELAKVVREWEGWLAPPNVATS